MHKGVSEGKWFLGGDETQPVSVPDLQAVKQPLNLDSSFPACHANRKTNLHPGVNACD